MARKVFTDFDFQNTSRPTNLPSPQSPGDAVNMAYVDTLVEGLAWKDSVLVATQGNINLASPGATIDGVTMTSQSRFLVRNQTLLADNGIYIWNGATSPATRALDANTFSELEQAVVSIEEGTDAGTQWRQTQVNGTLATSDIIWTAFIAATPNASEATAGKAAIATQNETDTGTNDSKIVSPLKLNNWAGRKLKLSGGGVNLGDGTATSFTITHNFNTRDVIVSVFPNSGQYDDVEVDVRRPTVNTVQLVFATAPASNAYRAVVMG